MRGALAFVLFLSAAAAAPAAPFDREPVYRGAGWAVDLIHDSDDATLWCQAERRNQRGQVLTLSAFDSGAARMVVLDPNWRLRPGKGPLNIDLGARRWQVPAMAEGQALAVDLEKGGREGARLVADLIRARAMRLADGRGRYLGGFALDGAALALAALNDCWNRIAPEG